MANTLDLAIEECVDNLIPRFQPRKDPQGCYKLNENSTTDTLNGLSTLKFSDPYRDRDNILMDPGLCVTHCANYLFEYAALGNGTDCRCGKGDALTSYIPVDKDLNCNIDCVGNSSNADKKIYKCGGKESYTVYSTDELPSYKLPNITIDEKLYIINHLNDNVHYKGCIKDNFHCNQRALNGTSKELPNMTVDFCINFCNKDGFQYAGLETGSQCFCAHDYNSLNMLFPEECSSSCAGNSLQICGGPLTISVYDTSTPPSSSNALKIGLGIGISIAVLLIFAVTYYFWRRHRNDRIKKNEINEINEIREGKKTGDIPHEDLPEEDPPKYPS